jgi:DNA-3-methyladenine glycosylase
MSFTDPRKNSELLCPLPSKPDTFPPTFYAAPPETVARALLGQWLFRDSTEGLTGGLIVETEAYLADGDPASHAAKGPNRKNQSMFGPAGNAYVYVIHARHCLNVVTEEEGRGSAVLIRALQPACGISRMRQRRRRSGPRDLTTGPARLCEAMNVTRKFDGHDLTQTDVLWIQPSKIEPDRWATKSTVRTGVTSGQELELRFVIQGNPFVSGPKSLRM